VMSVRLYVDVYVRDGRRERRYYTGNRPSRSTGYTLRCP
jgi:hypothetical protein